MQRQASMWANDLQLNRSYIAKSMEFILYATFSHTAKLFMLDDQPLDRSTQAHNSDAIFWNLILMLISNAETHRILDSALDWHDQIPFPMKRNELVRPVKLDFTAPRRTIKTMNRKVLSVNLEQDREAKSQSEKTVMSSKQIQQSSQSLNMCKAITPIQKHIYATDSNQIIAPNPSLHKQATHGTGEIQQISDRPSGKMQQASPTDRLIEAYDRTGQKAKSLKSNADKAINAAEITVTKQTMFKLPTHIAQESSLLSVSSDQTNDISSLERLEKLIPLRPNLAASGLSDETQPKAIDSHSARRSPLKAKGKTPRNRRVNFAGQPIPDIPPLDLTAICELRDEYYAWEANEDYYEDAILDSNQKIAADSSNSFHLKQALDGTNELQQIFEQSSEVTVLEPASPIIAYDKMSGLAKSIKPSACPAVDMTEFTFAKQTTSKFQPHIAQESSFLRLPSDRINSAGSVKDFLDEHIFSTPNLAASGLSDGNQSRRLRAVDDMPSTRKPTSKAKGKPRNVRNVNFAGQPLPYVPPLDLTAICEMRDEYYAWKGNEDYFMDAYTPAGESYKSYKSDASSALSTPISNQISNRTLRSDHDHNIHSAKSLSPKSLSAKSSKNVSSRHGTLLSPLPGVTRRFWFDRPAVVKLRIRPAKGFFSARRQKNQESTQQKSPKNKISTPRNLAPWQIVSPRFKQAKAIAVSTVSKIASYISPRVCGIAERIPTWRKLASISNRDEKDSKQQKRSARYNPASDTEKKSVRQHSKQISPSKYSKRLPLFLSEDQAKEKALQNIQGKASLRQSAERIKNVALASARKIVSYLSPRNTNFDAHHPLRKKFMQPVSTGHSGRISERDHTRTKQHLETDQKNDNKLPSLMSEAHAQKGAAQKSCTTEALSFKQRADLIRKVALDPVSKIASYVSPRICNITERIPTWRRSTEITEVECNVESGQQIIKQEHPGRFSTKLSVLLSKAKTKAKAKARTKARTIARRTQQVSLNNEAVSNRRGRKMRKIFSKFKKLLASKMLSKTKAHRSRSNPLFATGGLQKVTTSGKL